jgi:hypothetical protein
MAGRHADPDAHREAAIGVAEGLPRGPHRAAQWIPVKPEG